MECAQYAIAQTNDRHANRNHVKALRPGELASFLLSFFYFLLLLAAYYILRPVRDGLVALLGTDELKYLNLVVLGVMLALTPVFGALMTRIPRAKLLPAIYLFAIVNLLGFSFVFTNDAWLEMATRVYFVWIMVFNLFVISVFWSFMADIWNDEQARRLFGVIAAGGSTGGLLGPLIAQHLVGRLGNSGLVLTAATLLTGAMVCLIVLSKRHARDAAIKAASQNTQPQAAFSGSSLQSILLVLRSPFLLGIAALVCIGAVVAQFAYVETGRLARELYGTQQELTIFFARIDFWTNCLTLCFQGAVVGLLTARFGIKAPLVGLAVIGFLSFIPIALAPTLGVLAITNVIRRASEYGLGKPGRDMLYTVTTPQEKYLAKNVIDTLIYRGSDSLGNWLHSALLALGFTLVGLSWTAAALLAVSIFIALAVARGYRARGGK
jgi:AAA family ATP:ADP antiporter